MNRRQFISVCGACAVYSTCKWPISPSSGWADPSVGNKAKVRLVFCETANDKPIWPNIGYDFDARRNQVVNVLTQGCPNVELLPMRVMEGSSAETVGRVLQGDGGVDGYILCIQGQGWGNDVIKLSSTGKPTLLVDNLFGGSGKFLGDIDYIMHSGKPVNWVSSSNDQDIVASVRHFALLKQGKTPADVVAAFRTTRRALTPIEADWTCKDDKLPAVNIDEALKKLRETRILVIGGGLDGEYDGGWRSYLRNYIFPKVAKDMGGVKSGHISVQELAKASKEVVGVTFVPVSVQELADTYEQTNPDAAKALAQRWMNNAEEVVEPNCDEVERSCAMYLSMRKLIDKHGAQGITINCFPLFYDKTLKAYPCIGFSQLNNDGLVGACEADLTSALTMATIGALIGRPGFISDPVIDTSKNQIIYAHCVAMTKPFGPEGASNPYRIRTHSEDRKGVVIQSLLPAGYMTTTLRIYPFHRKVLMHQAKSVGNNPSDMACRTKLEATVKGDIEKLTENWGMGWGEIDYFLGWHRVTFYGDLREQVTELCDRLKLKLIEEA